ncbi:MAG TPA: glycoside hydrolase family 2 TIM barrel-domain containing protein, partial [Candidatus Goldiibacteriota bacterium]|nr:glycoside hydrolase family 2 TIM barrel-domain containing protein [Candidatus Goldiibacteriota bacterium]
KVIVNSPKEGKDAWPDRKRLIKGIFNHHDARPGSWDREHGQDMNTGGIWNSVEIHETGLLEIERVKMTPLLKDDGVWNTGHEMIVINNTGKSVEAEVKAFMEPYNFKGKGLAIKRKVCLMPGKNAVLLHFDIKQPKLWWTWDFGRPNLYSISYTVDAEGEKDIFRDISGIREFKKGDDGCWYLNGRRFFMRGSNIIPTQWLSEYTREKIRKDAEMIKEANLNTIRVHAHVQREEFYREMDCMGIMVWADFALIWGYDESAELMENAGRQIKDMVNLHYNRPSITYWCCHNEPFASEKQLDPVLYLKVREEDPVRYIDKASDFKQHYYPGWYYDATPLALYMDMQNAKKAFIVSEYGAQALPQVSTLKKMFKPAELFPPDMKAWAFRDFQPEQTFNQAGVSMGNSIEEFVENSQEYQARLITELTEMYRMSRYKYISGLLHFMMVECWPSITWAVIDYYRNPKKGYYALKRAMQPVYASYRLVRGKKQKGERMSWGTLWDMVYVINDTHQDIKNAKVEMKMTDADGKVYFSGRKTIKRIAPDDITWPFTPADLTAFEKDPFVIPDSVKAGKHRLSLKVTKDGKVISENEIAYVVTERF